MTTINCALNCEHQRDGKCMLDAADKPGAVNESCAYYSPHKNKEKTAK